MGDSPVATAPLKEPLDSNFVFFLIEMVTKTSINLANHIEILCFGNVQVGSQLSTIQHSILQEKQQIMDNLRQIENDLVEKEQIK